jgi:hypothetical protein
MPPCDFSERQYEFCANFELQATYGAFLIGGMPAIPSQIDEATDGYDAAYALTGGVTLYLQYKVSHFSPTAWGTGASTYALWNQPYFRTPLHADSDGYCTQHNTLIGLASPSAEPLYVAPCFHTKPALKANFAAGSGSVLDYSLLGPLSSLPPITDTDTHSITYPQDASAFRVHSEPSEPVDAYPSIESIRASLEPREWDAPYFEELRNELLTTLETYEVPPPEPVDQAEFHGPLDEIAAILDQRLGAVMVLFPL